MITKAVTGGVIAALILAVSYVSYQWGYSERDSLAEKQALAVSETARATEKQWQSRLGALEKDLLTATEAARTRAEHDQRSIRDKERQYKKAIQSCEIYTDYISELDSMLDNAVCASALSSQDVQSGCHVPRLQITHAERVGYLRAVIGFYEYEGLRANTLRSQINE